MNDLRIKQLELLDAAGSGLRVEFELNQDRWTHQVGWIDHRGTAKILLKSVEGNANDRWPPSPPFQELVIDSTAANQASKFEPEPAKASHVALLLGRAGVGHWSASFELFSDPIRLIADVACRSPEKPAFIGSTYRTTQFFDRSSDASPRLELARETNAIIELSAGREYSSRVSVESNAITIRPWSAEPQSTMRWRYAVSLLNTSQN